MAFLAEHEDTLEGDLLRFWGRDLPADLGTARLSWRRLALLIEQLPAESATARVIDPESTVWDLHSHLLAGIHDQLAMANWQRGGDSKHPRPKRLPRPGVVDPDAARRSQLSGPEILARLRAMKEVDGG